MPPPEKSMSLEETPINNKEVMLPIEDTAMSETNISIDMALAGKTSVSPERSISVEEKETLAAEENATCLKKKETASPPDKNISTPMQEKSVSAAEENTSLHLNEEIILPTKETIKILTQEKEPLAADEIPSFSAKEEKILPSKEYISILVEENTVLAAEGNTSLLFKEETVSPTKENGRLHVKEEIILPSKENINILSQEKSLSAADEDSSLLTKEDTILSTKKSISILVEENVMSTDEENVSFNLKEEILSPTKENTYTLVQENPVLTAEENMSLNVKEERTTPTKENINKPIKEKVVSAAEGNARLIFKAEPVTSTNENDSKFVQEKKVLAAEEDASSENNTKDNVEEDLRHIEELNSVSSVRSSPSPLEQNKLQYANENSRILHHDISVTAATFQTQEQQTISPNMLSQQLSQFSTVESQSDQFILKMNNISCGEHEINSSSENREILNISSDEYMNPKTDNMSSSDEMDISSVGSPNIETTFEKEDVSILLKPSALLHAGEINAKHPTKRPRSKEQKKRKSKKFRAENSDMEESEGSVQEDDEISNMDSNCSESPIPGMEPPNVSDSKLSSEEDDMIVQPPGEDAIVLPSSNHGDIVTWEKRLPPPPGCEQESQESNIIKLSSGEFEAEYNINDLSDNVRNYILLKGLVEREISDFSGASVSPRGQLVSPEETPLLMGKKSLHLHILGPTHLSVEMALKLIEKLNSEAAEEEQLSTVRKVPIGLEDESLPFDLQDRLLGSQGSNLQYIKETTGAEILLRGRNSGHPEDTSEENLDPLHIRIEHQDPAVVEQAHQLVVNLMHSVHAEYKQFITQLQQPPPLVVPTESAGPLMFVVPPPVVPLVYEKPPQPQLFNTPPPSMPVVYDAPPLLMVPPPQLMPMGALMLRPPFVGPMTLPQPGLTQQSSSLGPTSLPPPNFVTSQNISVNAVNEKLPAVQENNLKETTISRFTDACDKKEETSHPVSNKNIVCQNLPAVQEKKQKRKRVSRFSDSNEKKEETSQPTSNKIIVPQMKSSTPPVGRPHKPEFMIISNYKKADMPSTSVPSPSVKVNEAEPVIEKKPFLYAKPSIQDSASLLQSSTENIPKKLETMTKLLYEELQKQINTMPKSPQQIQLTQVSNLLRNVMGADIGFVANELQCSQLTITIQLLEKVLQRANTGQRLLPTIYTVKSLLQECKKDNQQCLKVDAVTSKAKVPFTQEHISPVVPEAKLTQSQEHASSEPIKAKYPWSPGMRSTEPRKSRHLEHTPAESKKVKYPWSKEDRTLGSSQSRSEEHTSSESRKAKHPLSKERTSSEPSKSRESQSRKHTSSELSKAKYPLSKERTSSESSRSRQSQSQKHASSESNKAKHSSSKEQTSSKSRQSRSQEHKSSSEPTTARHSLRKEQTSSKSSNSRQSQSQEHTSLKPTKSCSQEHKLTESSKLRQIWIEENTSTEPNKLSQKWNQEQTFSVPRKPPFSLEPTLAIHNKVQQQLNQVKTVPISSKVQQSLESNSQLSLESQSSSSFRTTNLNPSQLIQIKQLLKKALETYSNSLGICYQKTQLIQMSAMLQNALKIQSNSIDQQRLQLIQIVGLLEQALQTPSFMSLERQPTQFLQFLKLTKQALTTTLPPALQQIQSGNMQQSKLNQLLQELQQVTKLLWSRHQACQTSSQNPNEEFEDTELLGQQIIFSNWKELRITVVPNNENSLYSSLAHLTKGPFKTLSDLNSEAAALRWRAYNYIMNHKEMFFEDLNEIYDKTFPNHNLNAEMVFEHCCLYLAHPDKSVIPEPMLVAAATLFATHIVILFEGEGVEPLRIKPLYPSNSDPISVLFRGNRTHFDPIDEIVSNGFLVATWHVQKKNHFMTIPEKRQKIDECLAKHAVDVACLQGVHESGKQSSSDNYLWWCTTSTRGECINFLIRKKSAATLTNFTVYSSFLAVASILFENVSFTIVGCFFPEPTDNYHSEAPLLLQNVMKMISPSSQTILLGNFNAMIGWSNATESEFIGRDLYHKESNTIGLFLKEIAHHYKLRIVTTFQDEQSLSPATFKSGSGSFQISHILLQCKPYQTTKNIRWWEDISAHAIVASRIDGVTSKFAPQEITSLKIPPFIVATWHVRNCNTADKRENVDKILLSNEIDLACIQGVQGVCGQLNTSNYTWWCTLSSVSSCAIAFLLRKQSKASLSTFLPHTSTLASAIVSVHKTCFAVVGCHLPESTDHNYHQAAADLMLALNWSPGSAKLLLLGDFNAHIGSFDLFNTERSYLQASGLVHKRSNENGKLLKRLALLHELYICSSYVDIKNSTNVIPLQVSHILVQRHSQKNVASNNRFFLCSNHPIVSYPIDMENDTSV